MTAFGGITWRSTCVDVPVTYSCLPLKLSYSLIATNEIVAADAAADNNSNCSSVDILEVITHTLIDSDSPAQILT